MSLRFPDEIWEKLRRKKFEENVLFQEVGLELFTQWAEGKKEAPPPDPEMVTMMREYVELAEPAELRALKGILAGLLENVRHRSKARKRG
jgi:hypothetical protein